MAVSKDVQTISFWRGVLPHWEVVDGRYFITIRLAGTLPRSVEEELAAILNEEARDDYVERSRRYFRQLEHWLDASHGAAYLRRADIARAVVSTAQRYEDLGYWYISALVVMPTHIHAFIQCGTLGMSDVLRRFKKYTAREANRMLGRRGKRFWQREWFDHWSRSMQEDDRIISYIRRNPVKGGLVSEAADWPWTIWDSRQ